MLNKDFAKYILHTKLQNNSDEYALKPEFATEDFVYLPRSADYDVFDDPEVNKAIVSDFAVLNNCCQAIHGSVIRNRYSGRYPAVWHWCRDLSNTKKDAVFCYDYNGVSDGVRPHFIGNSSRVSLSLNVDKVVNAIRNYPDSLNISKYTDKRLINPYHTLEFGEYPQDFVGLELNDELENLLSNNVGSIRLTGKDYLGSWIMVKSSFCNHQEYLYNGKKYVRVFAKKFEEDGVISGNSGKELVFNDGEYYWCEVQPIKWIIANWDEMPPEINPLGIGFDKNGLKTTAIKLISQDGILPSIPFYKGTNNEPNGKYWQNSTIRGYLNGINVNNITTNGNPKFSAPDGGDFTDRNNFLTEAFDIDPQTLKVVNDYIEEDELEIKRKKEIMKKRKGYGVTIEENPMSVKEQMKFYINTGKSFMLHGPSGIGKTRRVEELDPDLVSVVLRKGMLPEEVIGKTIYPNNETSEGGEWKAPSWYVDICKKAEERGDEKVVLFLDELTNSLYEQNLVFHLTLNRCIQPNLGKLPDNVVVVAAGNNQDESASAYNMTEPLFRRFDGHIYLEPNIPEWLEWGSEESGKGEGRLKIHPLISNFVSTYGMDIFYTPYDRDNPPKHVLDPRGWEQVSDIVYDNNGVLAKELIENKIGSAIATNLIAFAKQPVITLEDVVENNYRKNEIPHKSDAKLALALSLRRADENEVGVVREFVRENLGEEMLATYDATWVGDNSERALLVNNLEEERRLAEERLAEEKRLEEERKLNEEKKQNEAGFDITVDDFWASEDSLYIHCDEEWKAKILTQVFDRMGQEWIDGESYADNTKFEISGANSYYTNDGDYSDIDESKIEESGGKVYNFESVDLSKYLTPEELSILNPSAPLQAGKKISIDDFWNSEENLYIHCDEEWKAEMLCSVFDKMGKKWSNGDSYLSNSEYGCCSNESCYGNSRSVMSLYDLSGSNCDGVYQFESVDLSKYLSPEDLLKIKNNVQYPQKFKQSDKFKITIDDFYNIDVGSAILDI